MSSNDIAEVEEKLITLVVDHPYLYDKSDKSYKDTVKKVNAWSSIAAQMQLEGGECERIWKRLRDQYATYLRKTQQPTGSGRQNHFYRHSELMRFYEPHYKPYKSVSNVMDESTAEESVIAEDNLEIELHGLQEGTEPAITVETARKSKSMPKRKMDPVDEKLIEALENNSKVKDIQKDEFELFGLSIIPKLRRINEKSAHKAASVQLKIHQLLLESEFE